MKHLSFQKYKERTEQAKRDYLKRIAVCRANQVSQVSYLLIFNQFFNKMSQNIIAKYFHLIQLMCKLIKIVGWFNCFRKRSAIKGIKT